MARRLFGINSALTDVAVFVIVVGQSKNRWFLEVLLKGHYTMDVSLHELVLKILWGVGFIAIGGAAALMFFLIFAQSILGSKTIHSQLEMLLQQSKEINERLRQIIQFLEEEKENRLPKT